MQKYSILIVLLCFAFTSEPDEKATVVLYRGREFLGHLYDIKFNDKLVASMEPGTFMEVKVNPGKASIESSAYRGTKKVFHTTAEAGQVYYLKAYEEIDFWDHYLIMEIVSADKAKKELKKCIPVPKVKQPD